MSDRLSKTDGRFLKGRGLANSWGSVHTDLEKDRVVVHHAFCYLWAVLQFRNEEGNRMSAYACPYQHVQIKMWLAGAQFILILRARNCIILDFNSSLFEAFCCGAGHILRA